MYMKYSLKKYSDLKMWTYMIICVLSTLEEQLVHSDWGERMI